MWNKKKELQLRKNNHLAQIKNNKGIKIIINVTEANATLEIIIFQKK